MPTLRRSRYLTCFYCGRKTSTRNDGSVRHFDCPSCDATNYLDENGEITDPPLEATAGRIRADSNPSFASPAREPSSDVFCATCLKNQRIFTSSLAQYLPDDPDDPEYEERERNFYRYRKGLEKQYPQVCAQCEPKVLKRIAKAGYTAKTDHLRRMIDRSRQERTPTAATSLLGAVGTLGRYMWVAGFALQALWHASIMRELFSEYQVSVWGGIWGRWVLDVVVGGFFAVLPGPGRLMKWSITVTAAGIWWNPFLVQTIRGFTKHLLGFSTWYTYQVIIMLLRILALGIPNISAQEASEVPTQLAAHAFMLGFVFYISRLALGAIRTDTTPLFASIPKTPLVMPEATPQRARGNEPASLSEILDDVLATPAAATIDSSPSPEARDSDSGARYTGRYPSPTSTARRNLWGPRSNGFSKQPATPNSNPFATPQEPQSVQYDMEMDWTPTQSKHRAFNSFGSPEEPIRGFGQTPAEGGDRRQFWYKVPPAPTSIAQRALNPPAAARLRKLPPVEDRSPVFGLGPSSNRPAASGEDRHEVAFKEPSFFPETTNDPRNTLSDLFGQAFSISPSKGRTGGSRRGSGSVGADGSPPASPPARWGSSSDMALLFVSAMLLMPGYATLVPPEYGSHLALGVCCLSLVVWIKVSLTNAKGLLRWATATTARRPWVLTAAVGSLIGLIELGVVARIALKCYVEDQGLTPCRAQGNWFISILVLHQLWNAFLGPLVQHNLTGVGIQVRR